nr:ATP-binding cassette domain-containing protein [Auraticoccus monumenti]
MDVRAGSGLHVLLGPNGAGKSTLLRVLAGQLRSEGTVRIEGPASDRRKAAGTGLMPQEPVLPLHLRLLDYVTYAAWLQGLGWREATAAAVAACSQVGLRDRTGDKLSSLSGGMRRRATFAAAVAHRPAVLLLDEPMSGLDPGQQASLRSLVTSYAAEHCVILSTHLLQDVETLEADVHVLHEGRLTFSGGPSQFLELGEGSAESAYFAALQRPPRESGSR